MNFGRNEVELSVFDYHLPADGQLTATTLQSAGPATEFEARVGAPKWGYKNWVGTVYPRGTKDAEFLRAYARQFNTMEFSATFYGLQSPEKMMEWRNMVSEVPDFKFCPKFTQSISHIRRLRNAEKQTEEFYNSIAMLRNNLGPVFLQLSDNFTPNSFADLKSYLVTLPVDVPLFLEVRHKNWFAESGHRSNLFNLLNELKIGAIITDSIGRRDCLHMELTVPHAFIRFVNSGDEQIDFLRLEEWVKRLAAWKQQGLQSLYFFIHAGDAPTLSLFHYFIPKLNEELGVKVKVPQYINQ